MKRYIIISFSLIFCFFTSISLFGQENFRINSSYQLLKTEQLSGNISHWIFYPAVREQNEKYIAIGRNNITWISAEKRESFPLPENTLQVIFSKLSSYFAVVSPGPLKDEGNRDKLLTIDVYSSQHEKRYSLQQDQPYDAPYPAIAVSEKGGALVMGENATGEVRFYNENGQLISEVNLFPGAGYDLERTLSMDLSTDGSAVAIAAGKRGSSPAGSSAPNPSAEPHLFLFSIDGTGQWRIPLPEFATNTVAISGKGNFIAANCYTLTTDGALQKETIVYNRNGKEITRTPLLFRYARFSADEKFLIIAENHAAALLDLTNEEARWNRTFNKNEGMITNVDITNHGKVTAILTATNEFRGNRFLFKQPQLNLFDREGNLFQNINPAIEEFKTPSLNIAEDAGEIFIGFDNEYQTYGIK